MTNLIYKTKSKQAGVTLLLAILILSSVMAISFSLATILFIEVRNSGDLIKTEPAFFGASAIAEESIFNVKRKACTSNCTYSTFSNNVNLPAAPVQSYVTTPIFQDRIAPGTNFNSANRYSLFDTTSQVQSTSGSGYGRITITYLDTGNTDPLSVYLCQFNPLEAVDPTGATPNTYNSTACSSPTNTITGYGDTYWPIANSNNYQMTPGTASVTHTWDLDPAKQQELILFNSATSGNYIYVKIEAFGSGPSYVPLGIPYAGQTAVEINAKNGSVGRKIRVVVPNTGGSAASTPTNISQGKTATQISTYPGLPAGNAVDGNTNGVYPTDPISHTNGGTTDWWEVDLGSVYNVSSVVIWNRTDCCAQRLTDYYVYVSNSSGGTDHSYHQTSSPNPSTTVSTPGASGRYVRVQLSGSAANNYFGYFLQLAEVQVFGTSGGGVPVTCATPGTNTFNACYYSDKTLTTKVLQRDDAYPLNFDWGTGSPDPSVPSDNFSSSWIGSFNFASGSHTFTMTGDDGVRLYIDGVMVIDQWKDQGPTTYTYTTSLSGTHTIKMEFYENGGGAVAKLSWN